MDNDPLANLRRVFNGPPGKFSPPDWPTFLDQSWERWALERKGEVGTKDAFYAGWHACMRELGAMSRE